MSEPRKCLPLYVLDVLMKHSDEGHRLSQADIRRLVEETYDTRMDRKTVTSNLAVVRDFLRANDYDIYSDESTRKTAPKTKNQKDPCIVHSGYFIQHPFEESELGFLMDLISGCPSLPLEDREDLIEKLGELTSLPVMEKIRARGFFYPGDTRNRRLFLNLDAINEGLSSHCQVSLLMNEEGGRGRQTATPLMVRVFRSEYYLIAYSPEKGIFNCPMDRVLEAEVLDQAAVPFDRIMDGIRPFDLDIYLHHHFLMGTDRVVNAVFEIDASLEAEAHQLFGTGSMDAFYTTSGSSVTVRALVDEGDMSRWAAEHLGKVRLLKPASLVNRFVSDLRNALSEHTGRLGEAG